MKGNKPSKKKQAFPVSSKLQKYLREHEVIADLPIKYEDLSRHMSSIPLISSAGEDTLWESVFYYDHEFEEINSALCRIYALLKTDGDFSAIEHLRVERIDFCTFGNTKPFRIRIINKINDNYDHFYIKRIDASRIYGLELERLLSPNWVSYLVDGTTIVEEHIAGVPGDDFISHHMSDSLFDQTRIAKEFVKFNERCFVRLLGDMRSYNYIVDITPDIEGNQYRIRAIDFDQQSFEGWKSFYLPQYFKENNPIIDLGIKILSPEVVTQYQLEERSLIGLRAKNSMSRLKRIVKCMAADTISEPNKVEQLKHELALHHKNDSFLGCSNMGELVMNNIQLVLSKEFKQSLISFDT